MPISRDEWKKGRAQDTLKARIEKLLESGQAYTLNEIGDYLFGKPRDFGEAILRGFTDVLVIRSALEELIEEGVVEAREVETTSGKVVYYAAREK